MSILNLTAMLIQSCENYSKARRDSRCRQILTSSWQPLFTQSAWMLMSSYALAYPAQYALAEHICIA